MFPSLYCIATTTQYETDDRITKLNSLVNEVAFIHGLEGTWRPHFWHQFVKWIQRHRLRVWSFLINVFGPAFDLEMCVGEQLFVWQYRPNSLVYVDMQWWISALQSVWHSNCIPGCITSCMVNSIPLSQTINFGFELPSVPGSWRLSHSLYKFFETWSTFS